MLLINRYYLCCVSRLDMGFIRTHKLLFLCIFVLPQDLNVFSIIISNQSYFICHFHHIPPHNISLLLFCSNSSLSAQNATLMAIKTHYAFCHKNEPT